VTPIESAAARFHEERAALAATRDELRREVLAALAGGMTEVEAARIAGVSRMTIRAWRR
jgi:transposase